MTKLKFDLVSDIHDDIWKSRVMNYTFDWNAVKNPDSDILVIAGDTSNSIYDTFDFATKASDYYEHVIIIDGNHEHYDNFDFMMAKNRTVDESMERLKKLSKKNNKIHYLDGQDYTVIDGVAFIGATGWYNWKSGHTGDVNEVNARIIWRKYSNDSYYPHYGVDQGPDTYSDNQCFDLKETVKELNNREDIRSIVVVTHVPPNVEMLTFKDDDDEYFWNYLNPSYVNEDLKKILKEDKNNKIKIWCSGHVHSRMDFVKDNILYVTNARGYPNEIPEPYKAKQLEV